jgi:RNA 3'-terminal phosphate cyclase (ATP)
MITIDGSQGEGGGQILRSSLALSICTGQPFKIVNIRAGRKKPGLMRQHLTAVGAARDVGGAEVEGAAIGSTTLVFRPGKIRAGSHVFAVGTAGSATLVVQTVLPALLIADARSHVTLEGGTHNPYAPPWDFLAKTFLPLVTKMGPNISTELVRPGFFPAGGGKFTVDIEPKQLRDIEITERGAITRRSARAIVSNLPIQIAQRELKIIKGKLNWSREWLYAEDITNSHGPGNVLMVELETEHVTEVFTGFGEKGILAEKVARQVVDEIKEYLISTAPVGSHLADQLMLPMALAGKGCYRTMPLTRHSQTNLDVIKMFLDIPVRIEPIDDKTWIISFG